MDCGMKKFIYILFSLLYLSACTKQDRDNRIIDQEKSIDTYLSGLGEEARIVRNGGASRVVLTEGVGEEIVPGDSVIFYYAGYIFSNGKGALFATNNKEVAAENGFETPGLPERKVAGGSGLIPGLNSGLTGAKKGEVCNIIFSARYGYGNTVVYNVPKLSPLFFEIWIESVIKN